jgi:hypothetical protein
MERPHVIQESDCLVQLPTSERSFMFGIPIKTERLYGPIPGALDTSAVHPQTHSMGSEAYLVRIIALWGRVTKYVNQGGRLYDTSPPWTPSSGFAKLNRELQEWQDGLPAWLKYSSSNLVDQVAISQAPSFVFMHVAYHTIVCTLHRFSVPSANLQTEESLWNPPPDFLQSSVKSCFEHAKSISTIMSEVISRSDCIVTAPFLGFSMFTANLFHLHQAFTPCPYVEETTEQAREFFATGVAVLNELRMWWGPLEMLYKAIRLLWQAKARNSQTQVEHAASKVATPAVAPGFDGQISQHQWGSGTTPLPTGTTPRPFWMSQPSSPGQPDHFDTTGWIPLPGGNFGLDFVDPNIYSSIEGETFGDLIFDNSQLETLARDPQYMFWGDLSPGPFGGHFDNSTVGTTNAAEIGKSPAPVPPPPGRPLSPFSNALHGFGRALAANGRVNSTEKSHVLLKKEALDEHKSILEQIHKDENSVMLPPPNSTPRIGNSTPVAGMSTVSPTSGTSHIHPSSATPQNDDKNEDGSEEVEAADLLVYFHARSGAGESSAIDDSIEVPGDTPRVKRAMSGDSNASSPTTRDRNRKRKFHEVDESKPSVTDVSQLKSGNIYPGKDDGTGTAKEVGKGLYLDHTPPDGSVDLLNLLRPGQNTGGA